MSGACGDVVGGAFFLATLTVEHASELNSSGVISWSLLLFILLMIPSQLRRSSSLQEPDSLLLLNGALVI